MAKLKNNLKSIITKLKAVKNIEIIIAIFAIALIILVYSFVNANSNSKEKTASGKQGEVSVELTEKLESDLADVLSNINGAGRVKVLITYSGTTQKVIANTKSVHQNTSASSGTTTSSTTTNTETPIMINDGTGSKLYVVEEKLPEIKGVVVVAEGAGSAKVRLEIMRAVQALLNVNANNIEIFVMK